MNIVVLDSGPLGKISNPKSTTENLECFAWARSLVAAGWRVVVPEIADYEIRSELIRVGSSRGLTRLDTMPSFFTYAPLTTEVMLRAAELWADVRRRGLPTASRDSLDGDAILAAQALVASGPGDRVVVATENAGHLGRFVESLGWREIAALGPGSGPLGLAEGRLGR